MLIHDKDQILKFIDDIYPKLVDDEVLFISLSSRTKYLTQEQKDRGIVINRNEMFHRRFFSGDLYNNVLKYLESINISEDVFYGEDILDNFYTTSGNNIPLNTVSVYVNINPSSMKKAAAKLSSEVITNLMENNNEWFLKFDSKLNTEVQRARSRRELIDIDFDVPDDSSIKWVMNQVKGYKIKTHSGYHLLIFKDDLKGINLGKVISDAQEKFDNKEIIINKNAMIPLPGTYQGNKKVRIE